jgi:hypothetical protein
LSKLLVEVAGEPVQVKVPAVWVLFELLGFLLEQLLSAVSFSAFSYIKIVFISAFVFFHTTGCGECLS